MMIMVIMSSEKLRRCANDDNDIVNHCSDANDDPYEDTDAAGNGNDDAEHFEGLRSGLGEEPIRGKKTTATT
jgi:hypothetical protein